MLNASLSDEIRGWRWVVHSVVEGAVIIALLGSLGPLTLLFVNPGGRAPVSEDAVAEMVGG